MWCGCYALPVSEPVLQMKDGCEAHATSLRWRLETVRGQSRSSLPNKGSATTRSWILNLPSLSASYFENLVLHSHKKLHCTNTCQLVETRCQECSSPLSPPTSPRKTPTILSSSSGLSVSFLVFLGLRIGGNAGVERENWLANDEGAIEGCLSRRRREAVVSVRCED